MILVMRSGVEWRAWFEGRFVAAPTPEEALRQAWGVWLLRPCGALVIV